MAAELSHERWSGLSDTEKRDEALRLARGLPDGFRFERIAACRMGWRRNQVAQFGFEDATFMLIPGGEVRLGYDADRRLRLNPDERQSWEETREEYGIGMSLVQFLASQTRRPRTVTVQPCLMESVAREVSGGLHAELSAELARAGFRFPTCDEWEWACGAGADTLYRWGDHVPCGDDAREWEVPGQPNAFGLTIAFDTYKSELTDEPDQVRGGDGGGRECGGVGYFVARMPLATAFDEPDSTRRNPESVLDSEYTVARRVLPLA